VVEAVEEWVAETTGLVMEEGPMEAVVPVNRDQLLMEDHRLMVEPTMVVDLRTEGVGGNGQHTNFSPHPLISS